MTVKANLYLRNALLFTVDAVLTMALFLFSCWASLDNSIFAEGYLPLLLVGFIWAIVFATMFALLGFYRIAMSRIGLFESMKIVLVAFGVDVVFYLMLFVGQNIPAFNIPWVLNWRVFALMVAVHVFATVALRFVPRAFRALKARFQGKGDRAKALLIGAGDAAKFLIDDARVNPSSPRHFVGALDDDRLKWGTTIGGVRVFGAISEAKKYIEELSVEEVIIAIPSLSPARYATIIQDLSSCDVRLRKLPSLGELDKVNETRVVDVSYRDLLGRPEFVFAEDQTKYKFAGTTVLITGGGGTLGGQIALDLLELGVGKVVLLDRYENGLTDVASRCRDLVRRNALESKVKAILSSVEDEKSMDEAMAAHRPDYVFHCAAVKHVPLAEDFPHEAIITNVIGTDVVCRYAKKHGVKEVFNLSTDKAAHPDSAMAKTKRLGELCCEYHGRSGSTRFTSLRFGNVLASKGSVVPIFTKQIEAGGPVTVTSELASRYFFTLEDCAHLILDAVSLPEQRPLYDLEAGRPTLILSLAESLIRQAGYIPYKDIDIVVTGLRHGEATPIDAPYDRAKQTPTGNPHIFAESFPEKTGFPELLETLKAAPQETCKAVLDGLDIA